MKTNRIALSLATAAFLSAAPLALAAGDPSKILVTIYGVAVSTSTDCSNPLVLFDSSTGVETDFLQHPVLGGGNIPDGTYPCVMINMSDVVRFSPAVSDGVSCVAGQTYAIDICRNDNGCSYDRRVGTTFSTGIPANGTNTVPSSDIVTMFLTTNAAGGGNDFQKPVSTADTTRGLPLGSPFVVSGSSAARFVVDATNQVSSGGGQCGLNAPAFSFR